MRILQSLFCVVFELVCLESEMEDIRFKRARTGNSQEQGHLSQQ